MDMIWTLTPHTCTLFSVIHILCAKGIDFLGEVKSKSREEKTDKSKKNRVGNGTWRTKRQGFVSVSITFSGRILGHAGVIERL